MFSFRYERFGNSNSIVAVMFTRLRAHKSQMRRFTPWCCRLAFIPQSSHVSKNWHSKPGRLFKNTQLFRLNAFLHSFSNSPSVTKVDSSVQQFQCQKNSCDISQEKFDLCGWSIFRRWTWRIQGYWATMVEIEVPNLQDWRSTSDGPLHVVFLVHLVSYLVSKQVITVQSSEKKILISFCHWLNLIQSVNFCIFCGTLKSKSELYARKFK